MFITDISIRHSLTVYVLIALLIVSGMLSYISLPREASPDITIPFIVVATAYFGVSPEDVETLVTQPLERELKGLDNLKEMRSTSSEGMSIITVEFLPNSDIDTALQKVRDKIDQAKGELPDDVEDPLINEINFSEFPILIVNLSGNFDLVRLKDIADDIEDDIKSIPGVLEVTVAGGLEREVQIDVDPARLNSYGVSLGEVVDTIARENVNIPSGKVDLGRYKYLLRVPGEIEDPAEVMEWVVRSVNGDNIYIRDLATVTFGFKERQTISRVNGKNAVTISISKRSGENLLRIANDIKQLLEKKRAALPGGLEISYSVDASKYVTQMVSDLENNIISGLLLVIAVLFVVMGLRNAFFVALAIPFSMLISFIVIQAWGVTLNMVVMFSLILALGMLVDNAIVIVENIYRHTQLGKDRKEAARIGVQEVAWPIITSTITTLCAFIPLLFWPGIVGEFMSFLPFTLIITLSASLFVAMVFNPVICANFMKIGISNGTNRSSGWFGRFLAGYRAVLVWALRHRALTLVSVVVMLIITVMAYSVLNHGLEFFPNVEPSNLYVEIEAPSGVNLESSDAITRTVEERVASAPDLESYVATVGASGGSGAIPGGSVTHKSRVAVDLVDRELRRQSSLETLTQIRDMLNDMTGVEIEVVKEEMGPPTGSAISIEVIGTNFRMLGELSERIKKMLCQIQGVINIKDDFDAGSPELQILVQRDKAARMGLSTRDIALTLRTAVNGTEASKYRVGEDEYDITVRFRESARSSVQDLRNIRVPSRGGLVPLANLATLKVTSGPGAVRHKDIDRVVSVTADVAEGYNANDLRVTAATRLRDIPLPPGYATRFSGEDEEQREAMSFLSKAFMIALFLIALVLITQFDSLTMPFTILISIILSFTGVLWGLVLLAKPFTIIMTGIGVISLAGVVVNNAIVLIDFIRQLRAQGMKKSEAIVEAGTIRARPVLLTAVTTILGLIPLTTGVDFNFHTFRLDLHGESSQWWGPMGAAVIFGLAFATILTLVVVPVLYSLLERE
ncbi:efflux RND transporter permease subunit [bacterium]|nr:efflux RND transporter permease subunit [candidate division CSSED10-310 bacterium]